MKSPQLQTTDIMNKGQPLESYPLGSNLLFHSPAAWQWASYFTSHVSVSTLVEYESDGAHLMELSGDAQAYIKKPLRTGPDPVQSMHMLAVDISYVLH